MLSLAFVDDERSSRSDGDGDAGLWKSQSHLDENFGLVTECLEVMMMMVAFLERHKVATDSNLPKSKLVVAGNKPWNTERGRASICFYGSLLCALHVF